LCVLCVLVVLASLPASGQVIKGSVPAPAGSSILVPAGAFPGGVLTGVVIGPDDKPVANAQVNLAEGVPITLSGEVIGDQPPDQKPPNPNKPPSPNLTPLRTPQDCAGVLQKAAALDPNGPPLAWSDPQGQDGEIGDITSPTGGTIKTDAQGRFALCVLSNAKQVDVSLGDGSVHTSVPAVSQFPPDPCAQAGRFFQPAARLSVCQRLSDPTLTQGDQTWTLQRAVAISAGGDRVLTSLRTPRDLKPGPATLSFVNGDGKPEQFTGGVFKIVNARLDRAQLHSHQGADFEYTVQFGDGSVRPCVHITVAGPIALVQPPPEIIAVDASGIGHFSGKIRATQVAPGTAVPFVIQLSVSQCGSGPQSVGEQAPGPPGSPGNREMKLSLTPGPVAVNQFVKQTTGTATAPTPIAMNPPAPTLNGPEHTMDSTNKYAKAPAPMSSCNFQNKTPVINNVVGVKQPTVFTQENGLNYFTIQGCNFGATAGHVYLMLRKNEGIGFPNQVELYLTSGNNPWEDNSIAVLVDPSLSGYLDQDGVILRVVTAKGLTAERDRQVFHAERVPVTMLWMPRSQVQLGDTNASLTPTFTTSPPGSTLIIADSGCSSGPNPRGDAFTAGVDRSISNVGSPFTAHDDIWDFSKMRPGFDVAYATPSYENWDGAGCSQTSGKWGTYWDSATSLRVHVQGCYHSGTGDFRSSNAHYALLVCARGPKGVQPWPDGMK
jgi:hypothetical protein